MKIADIEIKNGICLAPLAGVSDRTFRAMARRFGAEYTVSEMVSAKALRYEQLCKKPITVERTKTAPLAAVLAEELPMAVQLFGAEPEFVARAAALLESNDYRGTISEVPPSVIDINMGCPMAKIVGNGDGCALMKNVDLAASIVAAVAGAVPVPVTVKCRLGWDKGSINVLDLARAVEDAGAAALSVHGRTRTMLYSGVADWDTIAKVKDRLSIPVIANGDIMSGEAAVQCLRRSHADGLMVGRAAFGDPWIFREIDDALSGREIAPRPPLCQRVDTAVRQLELAREDKGEHIACLEARKHFAWYLRGVPYSGFYKDQISHIGTMEDIYRIAKEIKRDLK